MKKIILAMVLFFAQVSFCETPEQKPPVDEQPEKQKFITWDQLSEDERKIMDRGEIGTAAYVIGGIVGTYPIGLGVGHAIQGRYQEKGWIFTVGEVGSIAVAYTGLLNCAMDSFSYRRCDSSLIFLGLLSYVGFRVWEIIDVWAAPPDHNRRYRRIRKRMGPTSSLPTLYVSQVQNTPVFGLSLTF